MYEFVKEHYLLLMSAVVCAVITTGWVLYGGKRYEQSNSIQDAQSQLRDIGVQQQIIVSEVKESRERISESRRELSELTDVSRSNSEIISECKQIVAELERRDSQREAR